MSATQAPGLATPVHSGPVTEPADLALPDRALDRVADQPTFQTLVRERTRFGWILTILMLLVYFGFIGLIAFDKALLATKVGGTASLGFYMGMFVIVFAFVLTGIYVARANTRFDRLSAELTRSLAK